MSIEPTAIAAEARESCTLDPVAASMVGYAQTVLGAVPAERLGWTLPHEHVFIINNFWNPAPTTPFLQELAGKDVTLETLSDVRQWPLTVRANGLLGDFDTAVHELQRLRGAGGRTVVDLTCQGIGQDPLALCRVARVTGLNIIAGCGYYMGLTHPMDLATRSVEEVAAEFHESLTVGIGATGVRAGVIGEIGTSEVPTDGEERCLRAAARAALATGAPVFVHHVGTEGHRILDLLEAEGLTPGRVVICHLDFRLDEDAYHASLAQRGAYVEYDLFGSSVMRSETTGLPFPSDLERVRALRRLAEAGFGRQLLCSQDVCTKVQLRRYGGSGYAHIFENLVCAFRHEGFSDDDLEMLFRENPARVIAWTTPSGRAAHNRPTRAEARTD